MFNRNKVAKQSKKLDGEVDALRRAVAHNNPEAAQRQALICLNSAQLLRSYAEGNPQGLLDCGCLFGDITGDLSGIRRLISGQPKTPNWVTVLSTVSSIITILGAVHSLGIGPDVLGPHTIPPLG